MKVLFVLEHFHPYIGGAESLFLSLARELVAQGHGVGVVTTRFRSDLPEVEMMDGITIHRVTCHNRFLFSFFSLSRVWKVAGAYDLIQTTSYNAALPAWIVAFLRRMPAVITFHEVWGRLWWQLPWIPMPMRLAYWCWERWILLLPFHRFVAVSRATAQSLIHAGKSPKAVTLIYNGLPEFPWAAYGHQPPGSFIFTYFGRLGYSKGLDILVPAALRFLEAHPDARFCCIIPTYPRPLYNRILRQIHSSVHAGRIELWHDLDPDRLFHLVAHSSCVVIPSYSEGFCFVAAEAVAIGVPVVHSGRAALAEVAGGKTITIDNLTEAAMYKALVDAHREAWTVSPPRSFPLEDAVRGYVALYEEVTGSKKSAG
ncbi:MAG: glycosyltransferase family 4 protein [Saprospiraceae bacterium]|nr:glycosyltransferase family 4 protein [Saprospiraceae bacterium]